MVITVHATLACTYDKKMADKDAIDCVSMSLPLPFKWIL